MTNAIISAVLNSAFADNLVKEVVNLWREHRHVHNYKVLSHSSTLELNDEKGKNAVHIKRQEVVYLSNPVFAIQDQVWGDGDIFADYQCTPGTAVDHYQDGYRWKVLISLRENRSRGDKEELIIQRTIKNGFVAEHNTFGVIIDHPTRQLSLAVKFPKERQPRNIYLIEQNSKRAKRVASSDSQYLPHGQVQYACHIARPRLFEHYTMKWVW